jgi:hypothetical protein
MNRKKIITKKNNKEKSVASTETELVYDIPIAALKKDW